MSTKYSAPTKAPVDAPKEQRETLTSAGKVKLLDVLKNNPHRDLYFAFYIRCKLKVLQTHLRFGLDTWTRCFFPAFIFFLPSFIRRPVAPAGGAL